MNEPIDPWPFRTPRPVTNINPQVPLTDEDLRQCPSCGSLDDMWLNENAKRFTWQPMSLDLDEEGRLTEADYESFDYGDDVEHEYYACRCCEDEWVTLEVLQRALQAAANARADAAFLEQTLGDDVMNALAACVCNTKLRFALEDDPKLLEQARAALGLPVLNLTNGGKA